MYKLLIFALYIGLIGPVYGEDSGQDISFLAENIENGEALSLSTGSSSGAGNIVYAGVSLNYINSSTAITYGDRKTIYPVYVFFGLKGPWKISPYIEGGIDLLDIVLDDLFSSDEKDSGVGIDYYYALGLKFSVTNQFTVSVYAKEYVFKFEEELTRRQVRLSPGGYGVGVTFHF